jgi:hypothetical protein
MPDGGIQSVAQTRADAFDDATRLSPAGARLFSSPPLLDPGGPPRHPWLKSFETDPRAGFDSLVTGHADIGAMGRLDITDAANALFGNLSSEDPARLSLGWAILDWLEKRRQDSPPRDTPGRQRWIREVRDALDIVAMLQIPESTIPLRRGFASWNAWVADLTDTPSRDARAAYWSMLAQTQPLIHARTPIDPFGLVPHWLWVCENAGASLPDHYLGIGLLGLRRLPDTAAGSEMPWLTGLAYWADSRRPSRDRFRTEWFALKFLYPRTPARWRSLLARVLSAPRFKAKDIASPAWWDVDPDLR